VNKAELAEFLRKMEGILGQPPRKRPRVVARDDAGIVRDADVHVSRADPNADGQERMVEVRRAEYPWERRR
jgi:hypothetical protein